MKKKLILAAAGALSIFTLAACSNGTNQDIATMKGGTISVEDFYNEAKNEQSNQSLVQRMIIFKVFDNKYGDKVTDKMINAEYNKQKKQFGDSFDSQLQAAGYSKDTFKDYIKNNLALEQGLKAHIKLTDKDMKTAWDAFHPEVEAQIVKVASEDEAKNVKKSADDGEDFAKLAKDKSTDEATKADGGKLKFDSQSTNVPEEVKEAAFKLKDNQVSDVITSTDTQTYTSSYYVVKMDKTKAKGNDMKPYEKEIKQIAEQAKLSDNAFSTKVIAEELKDANVKVKDDSFKNVLSNFTETSDSKATDSSSK